MTNYNTVLRILKDNGLNDSDNVCDFWFKNIDRLRPLIYGPAIYDDTFSTQVRWKSELGQSCQKAIHNFIEATLENVKLKQQELFKAHNMQIVEGIIDFSSFTFIHQGGLFNISMFANSFNTSQSLDRTDLRGIDFSGIWIQDCIIKNCWLDYANFDDSYLCQVTFNNTNLGNASFKKSNIVAIKLENKSSIGGVDLTGANINIINGMTNDSLLVSFIFNEVSYFWLIRQVFLKLQNKNFIIKHSKTDPHTFFLSNDTLSLTSNDLKSTKEYMDWFQNVCKKINNLHKFETSKKISFILTIISTKYWTSYSAFAIFSIFLNLIFTLCIFVGHSHFSTNGEVFKQDFITSFYYSTLAFTTLGFGDISPNSYFGQFLVIIEVITGYFTLGLFVYLISRKIDRGN